MKTDDISDTTVLITDIQRFCMHDGPGVRTTVFFKGCPLHCKWCHNAETQSAHPEILFEPTRCVSCGSCENVCEHGAHLMKPQRSFDRSRCLFCGKCAAICPAGALSESGRTVTVLQIMETVKKDLPFYGKQGGLTVSGGEPTLQANALFALLGAAKEAGLSTSLETCGVFPKQILNILCPLTDLFLFDIKDTDSVRLKENTGADLDKVLSNLHAIDNAGEKTVLRCILIPEINLNAKHCERIAELYRSLANCRYVELLPYHPYGTSKAKQLGRAETQVYRIPEREEVLSFAENLKTAGVTVKCFGTILT